MKFGKKRSSPEPEPVDITHRLSILDLRTSARAAAPAAAPSTSAPAQPPAAPTETAAPERPAPAPTPTASASPAPTPPAPAPLPVATEPAPHVPAPAAEVAQPAQTPVLAMPDAAAYEMAAFELSSPPTFATAPPAPEPVIEPAAEHTPEPVIEPVADALPPAWSYEQVARIENAEHHVTAWVQPGAAGQPEPVEQEPELHPVAVWEQPSPEELVEPIAEAAVAAGSPVAESTGWGVPVEPDPAPEPDRHPVAEWETPEPVATPESHDLPAAEVPDQRVEEPAASVDLTEPAAEDSPEVDLTELVEHDPVYASVEAAARLEQPRDDDGVVRWRW